MPKILFAILLISLTSCSSTVSKEWSKCRSNESKLGCANISDADQAYSKISKDQKFPITQITNLEKISEKGGSLTLTPGQGDQEYNMIRIPEKVGRIWLAPYIDNNGNIHEASYVKVIDQSSKWKITKRSNGKK